MPNYMIQDVDNNNHIFENIDENSLEVKIVEYTKYYFDIDKVEISSSKNDNWINTYELFIRENNDWKYLRSIILSGEI